MAQGHGPAASGAMRDTPAHATAHPSRRLPRSAREVTCLAWACAVLDIRTCWPQLEALMGSLHAVSGPQVAGEGLSPEDLSQLWQVHMWLQVRARGAGFRVRV
jgi:hypothetical protein